MLHLDTLFRAFARLVINIFNLIAEMLFFWPHADFTIRICHVNFNYISYLNRDIKHGIILKVAINMRRFHLPFINGILALLTTSYAHDQLNLLSWREKKKRTIKHNFYFLRNRLVLLWPFLCSSLFSCRCKVFYQYEHIQSM